LHDNPPLGSKDRSGGFRHRRVEAAKIFTM
jgi:hypothetical protein